MQITKTYPYKEGCNAAWKGWGQNPYPENTAEHQEWQDGFVQNAAVFAQMSNAEFAARVKADVVQEEEDNDELYDSSAPSYAERQQALEDKDGPPPHGFGSWGDYWKSL